MEPELEKGNSSPPNSHSASEVYINEELEKAIQRFRRRQWHPTPVLLPRKSHGRRSLVGCSPWGHEELDTTERLHFHFSLSCIGEGNGNPLQCSYLENPRDGGAWWAAVYGVTQSRTRLKRLSSSSSIQRFKNEIDMLQVELLALEKEKIQLPKEVEVHLLLLWFFSFSMIRSILIFHLWIKRGHLNR